MNRLAGLRQGLVTITEPFPLLPARPAGQGQARKQQKELTAPQPEEAAAAAAAAAAEAPPPAADAAAAAAAANEWGKKSEGHLLVEHS